MPRAGILYSQVANAAAALAAAGANPTVDNVRAALGDTGSKSTIGPMLKQWKAEHQGEAVAASTGLPADLLQAVKAVHQRIEAAAQAQVEQLRAEHEQARQEATLQLEAERAAGRQLRAEREALTTELASVKAALAHERDERQHAAVAIAALQAEQAGLTKRLADRAGEVEQLADQLEKARDQFENYREKAAELRQADRQAADARATAKEGELAVLRGQLQERAESLAALRTDKHHLQARLDDAIAAGAEAQAEAARTRTERDHAAAALARAESALREAAEHAELVGRQLGEVKQELAERQGELKRVERDLHKMQNLVDQLNQDALNAKQERHRLEQMLRETGTGD
ncbi:DNA-binding protein [Duganella vulcania]|uniref:KfrA N-terminal DNA-binding domain-containing protein n=1 Tax=Duganella vulcania TaxID=2692166 RepID=A0A845GH27_9BURK|nr:DNA-binding protein [Duganella vulcania]MYM92820.1 hypothetical protein [Duganella vulcania]